MEIMTAISMLCLLMLATPVHSAVHSAVRAGFSDNCDMMGCAAVYKPICGTDDKTYGNVCELAIAQCTNPALKLQHYGTCDGSIKRSIDPCEMRCFAVYDPVCGTDNVTYGNFCELAVASCKNQTVAIAHGGKC